MKFFHLSDLHIGKQLHHYNMIAEQRDILGKIVALAEREKPDAVLIAGDIYDTPVPSAEAVSVFDEFLTALNDLEPEVTVCIIAGNHDSAKRIDLRVTYWQTQGNDRRNAAAYPGGDHQKSEFF